MTESDQLEFAELPELSDIQTNYLKTAYEHIFGNFPFEIIENKFFQGTASEKEIEQLQSIYKNLILSVCYLTKEEMDKSKPVHSISRIIQ